MKKRTQQPQLINIRNDILKLLYAGMLLEMPLSLVREFWARHPLPDAVIKNDESYTLHSIWQAENRNPIEYLVGVFNDVEPFLISHGMDTVDFLRKTLQRVNKGMLISARSILRWGKPFLSYFYLEKDPRPLILRLIDFFTAKLAPGTVHKLVKHESGDTVNKATILVMYSRPMESFRLHTKSFYREFPSYDCELWTGMLVQAIPSCMNMPVFEELFMLSDCRKIEEILPDSHITMQDEKLLIDGEVYGNIINFTDFWEKKALFLHKYRIPDKKVVTITRDYFCPIRKRIIIHANCVYNAPVYLYGFRYHKDVTKPENFMSTIIDEATGKLSDSWSRAREIHETLLEKISLKADITYFNNEQSISINGNHLVKFVPAKILRKMIVTYLNEGRTLFEHREFIRDEQIIFDSINPNLNIRLQRLEKVLKENFPEISISREERGKIRLHVDCKASYCEQ